jgi:hypothetical protein
MSSSAYPEIASPELTRCQYFVLRCPNCGDLRAAVEKSPARRLRPCPACQREVVFTFIGKGLTRRVLPFWEKASYWLPEAEPGSFGGSPQIRRAARGVRLQSRPPAVLLETVPLAAPEPGN